MTAQTQIDFARQARDLGIAKAINNADAVTPRWSDQAYGLFKDFVKGQSGPFKIEDFRVSTVGVLSDPPSLMAFGHVALRAVKSGLIKRVGYECVSNVKAHRTPVSVWEGVK